MDMKIVMKFSPKFLVSYRKIRVVKNCIVVLLMYLNTGC